MNIKGGCYCGAIRYEFEGDVTATFQCHCRECQYFTGGHANAFMSYRKINLLLLKAAQRGFVDRTYKNLSNVCFALIVEPNLWRFLQKGPLRLY